MRLTKICLWHASFQAINILSVTHKSDQRSSCRASSQSVCTDWHPPVASTEQARLIGTCSRKGVDGRHRVTLAAHKRRKPRRKSTTLLDVEVCPLSSGCFGSETGLGHEMVGAWQKGRSPRSASRDGYPWMLDRSRGLGRDQGVSVGLDH
jgi:hypothetical protein